jgi:FixJ family two-component response regulator
LPTTLPTAIVDDDQEVREALSDLLQVTGFAWQTFDRAETFLAGYAPGRFGCLIVDVKMPGMTGLELLQRLQAQGASPPVIIITSVTDSIARARAREFGAHAYLTKPVAEEVLLLHLRSALRASATEDEEPADGKQ